MEQDRGRGDRVEGRDRGGEGRGEKGREFKGEGMRGMDGEHLVIAIRSLAGELKWKGGSWGRG